MAIGYWKGVLDIKSKIWTIVAGVISVLLYLGINLKIVDLEFKNVNHVVIKSTADENDKIGKAIKTLLASKKLKVTGPESIKSPQKKELDRTLKVFHKADWVEAEKIKDMVFKELEYALDIVPAFDQGNIVDRGQLQIWLKN